MKRPIALRIEADLLVAARRCAAEENRTFTNLVETVLKARIAGRPCRFAGPPGHGVDAASASGAAPSSGGTAGGSRRHRRD